MFWYGCSHCYNLEPVLSDWVKKLPADVSFVRIPVMWNPTNEIHGRIYYTAEALGKLDQINPAMFKAIHVENRPMTEEKDILAFFEQNGVSAADFNKTFRSFAVESQLKRAKDLTVKYQVRGVPAAGDRRQVHHRWPADPQPPGPAGRYGRADPAGASEDLTSQLIQPESPSA